ncbi:MAG: ribosome recycling factor [Verrucomicrobiae bacterium]|nr:ribosome recycling factor [Verrucomicrobiae bacterium]MCB1091180.1 ribosome recycling factor [Verrucomicrobiae bacterium]
MDPDEVMLETEEAMQKSVDYVLHEMSTVRTGKASPALVEGIDVHVVSYGSHMKLRELALIATPEPRLLTVQPYDVGTKQDILRALRESRLGINPADDGKIIRLPIPELSHERRVDLSKVVKDMAEQGRVRVRGARRDGIDKVKALQKAGAITEDDLHRMEKEVQNLTDQYVKEIDQHVAHKEKEIMTV